MMKRYQSAIFFVLASASALAQYDIPNFPEIKYAPAAQRNWISERVTPRAKVYRGPAENQVSLDNGLLRRTFLVNPEPISLQTSMRSGEIIASEAAPELQITIDGRTYTLGQQDIAQPDSWRLFDMALIRIQRDFKWTGEGALQSAVWPTGGAGLRFRYANSRLSGVIVDVEHELYDMIPVLGKRVQVRNTGRIPIRVDSISLELGALDADSKAERVSNIAMPGTGLSPMEKKYAVGLILRPGDIYISPQILTVADSNQPFAWQKIWTYLAPWTSTNSVLYSPRDWTESNLKQAQTLGVDALTVTTSDDVANYPELDYSISRNLGLRAILKTPIGPGKLGADFCWLSRDGKDLYNRLLSVTSNSGTPGIWMTDPHPIYSCDGIGHPGHQNEQDSLVNQRWALKSLWNTSMRLNKTSFATTNSLMDGTRAVAIAPPDEIKSARAFREWLAPQVKSLPPGALLVTIPLINLSDAEFDNWVSTALGFGVSVEFDVAELSKWQMDRFGARMKWFRQHQALLTSFTQHLKSPNADAVFHYLPDTADLGQGMLCIWNPSDKTEQLSFNIPLGNSGLMGRVTASDNRARKFPATVDRQGNTTFTLDAAPGFNWVHFRSAN
ncbi:MAG: hypothetical protein KDC26_05380 [Armatimonadetes bacterium]|nr:hypothetical protein [Armatimonadota bacterium]